MHRQPATLFDRVFVVNLRHRSERWRSISDQLARAGVRPEIITRYDAVVGAAVDADALVRDGVLSRLCGARLRRPESQRIWGMDMSPGAVGCALSHIDLWATIAARNMQCALVLEDDSLVPSDFLEKACAGLNRVDGVLKAPGEWDLVYLSGLDTDNTGHRLEVCPGVRLVPAMHRTTNCYAVTASGARRLLETCVPLTFQLDTEMTTRISTDVGGVAAVTGINCFSVHPSIVVQATRFGSDIQAAVNHDTAAEELSRCKAAGWDTAPR